MARIKGFAVIAIIVVAAGAAVGAQAHEHVQGSLTIVHPWSRATAPSQKAGGVYLKIQNAGGQPDRLIGIETDMADAASLHATTRDGDIVIMRPVEGGVEVPANGEVELAPGGQHVMLFGLHQQLIKEATIALTLIFERAGRFEIVAVVEAAGSRGGSGASAAHDQHGAAARSGK